MIMMSDTVCERFVLGAADGFARGLRLASALPDTLQHIFLLLSTTIMIPYDKR